jgi:hypothetical protein
MVIGPDRGRRGHAMVIGSLRLATKTKAIARVPAMAFRSMAVVVLPVCVCRAEDRVAFDELLLSPPGVTHRCLGEPIEIAEPTAGGFVEHRDRVAGEVLAV